MPITCEFEYHKPKSLPEAIKILSRDGKNASVLAGGTDLPVWMEEGLRGPSAVVGLRGDESLPEAIKILSRDGKNASVLAGGTDLLVWMKEGLRAPSAVVDVKGIGELHSLEASDGSLLVGACVTFTELLESAGVRGRPPPRLGPAESRL